MLEGEKDGDDFTAITIIHLHRGALKYHVKLYSGAIEDLNTAISLDPTHAALAYFNRALCFEATGNLHQVHSSHIVHVMVYACQNANQC